MTYRKTDVLTKLPELSKGAVNWQEIYTCFESNGLSSKDKGTLFEHFFYSAYPLKRDDVERIWLFSDIPPSIKQKLNFAKIDHGVDILIQNKAGSYIAVQCKYTNNPERKLSWSKDKLTNFFAEAKECEGLLLFSNAAGIDRHSKDKNEKLSFLHPDELSLNKSDIEKIPETFAGARPKSNKTKIKAHKYQEEAIQAVLEGFRQEKRGQLILPCGAGKTLVSFWIWEKLKVKKTLILVPSLALLRQFKESWQSVQKEFCDYLCVCSEKDIAYSETEDNTNTQLYELDAPARVSANPKTIRKFLQKTEKQIIYATYQSAGRLVQALKNTSLCFDLTVCDEAHKTATARAGLFALIHDDKKIPCKKSLYMTATPRVITSKLKKSITEKSTLEKIVDMSKTQIFGLEFYRMSFDEGIRQGFLADYQIVVMGVSDREAYKAIEERRYLSDVQKSGETIEDMAKYLALEKALSEHEARHVISFHNSIKRAALFSTQYNDKVDSSTASYHVVPIQSIKTKAGKVWEIG